MWRKASLLCFGIMLCPGAYAQDGMMGVWDTQMTGMVDYARTVSINAAIPKKKGASRVSASRSPVLGGPSGRSSVPPAKSGVLRFSPSADESRRIKKKFTKALVKANPQSAAEIESTLGQQDVIADFARDMAPYGLRADDVADTMTAYWITMWMIANQEPAPDVQKVGVVQRQIGATVVQDATIVNTTDTERQRIAEGFIYETMLAFGMLNNASKDPTKLQQLADDAQRNMLKKGVDLRRLRLTTAGFTRI